MSIQYLIKRAITVVMSAGDRGGNAPPLAPLPMHGIVTCT